MKFEKEIQLRFREIDSAGIMYFGVVFDLAHDLYEACILNLGFTYQEWFQNPDLAFPIVHAEADYQKPLLGGQSYLGSSCITRIGESSFSMEHEFSVAGSTCATVRMTHVCMDPNTKKKTALPEKIRTSLIRYQL